MLAASRATTAIRANHEIVITRAPEASRQFTQSSTIYQCQNKQEAAMHSRPPRIHSHAYLNIVVVVVALALTFYFT